MEEPNTLTAINAPQTEQGFVKPSSVVQNISLLAGTIFVFVIAQKYFWIYVGSQQFEKTIQKKTTLLDAYLTYTEDVEARNRICSYIEDRMKSTAGEKQDNMIMLSDKIDGWWISALIIFLLFACVYVFLERGDKKKLQEFALAFGLLLFSFSTEIIIFLYIIQPYVFVGDIQLANQLFNSS